MRTSITNSLILAIGWFALFQSPANAYLDPTTGAYFIQILAGFALAIILSARNKWKSFLELFTKKPVEPSSKNCYEQTDKLGRDE